MKRIISILLSFLMFSASVVFADAEVSDIMEEALTEVKSKVSVSDSLSEFESSVHTEDGNVMFSFEWHNEDYTQNMRVASDENGRITSYWYNNDDIYNYQEGKKLANVSREEVEDYVCEFAEQVMPEAFDNETDCFVYIPEQTSAQVGNGYTRYSLNFKRIKNGIPVKDNYANVYAYAVGENVIVNEINAVFDYKTEFTVNSELVDNYISAYKQSYPIEAVYENDYSLYRSSKVKTPVRMAYRIKDNKAGYINASDGKPVEEDSNGGIMFAKNSAMTEEAADMSAGGAARLTEAEIAEIKNISGLKGAEEVKKTLLGIPQLGLKDTMLLNSSSYYKNDGEYILTMRFSAGEEQKNGFVYAEANAATGEILSVRNYTSSINSDEEITKQQAQNAKNDIEAFLKLVCSDKIAQCQENVSEDTTLTRVQNKYYVRLVNGIPYIGNGITVSYDAVSKKVTDFSVHFEDCDFPAAENAIGEEKGYEKLLEAYPVDYIYVKSNNKYVLCCGPENTDNIKIDAHTGEKLYKWNSDRTGVVKYNDIEGQWYEKAVKELANVGIAFDRPQFDGEKAISQSELLRLFAAGRYNARYITNEEDDVYEYLISTGILTEAEKAPEAAVTREDACVYLIRFMDAERYACLENIYKVNFADMDKITHGRIGYIAILSGLGVICGDGGEVRPDDYITRAEASAMIYNYLSE